MIFLSPHESLANLIEAGTIGKSRYVGGMYQREGNNILLWNIPDIMVIIGQTKIEPNS